MPTAEPTINDQLAALLVVLCTSILLWFGNGLEPWWPLLWFAPLPVLLFACRTSWWKAGLTAALSFLLGSLNMWHYFRVLHAPAPTWVGIYSVIALVFTMAVLLFRALVLRRAPWSAVFAFPALWVSAEYLANLLTPNGTAGSLAYSQLRFLPFLQLASVTGPWGMSFLLFLFPAALVAGINLRRIAPKLALQIMASTLGTIILVLIFGAVRLSLPVPGPRVRVGLVASDEPANVDVAEEGAATERLFRDYSAMAEELAGRGAQVIVLPEKLGVAADPNIKESDAIFQSLADRNNSIIVAGLVHVSPPVKYNQARVYAPGSAILSYNKHHLLPPFESMLKPGTTLALMREASAVWGVAICKDMDFTPLARQYGKSGVGLMMVPGWDFGLDRSWHGHIAVMRGVEDGFSIVRAAKQGYLTVSDDRGRILGETRSDSAPFATLMVDAPVLHQTTLYLLVGDWFPWVAMAILVLTIVQSYRAPGRSATPLNSIPHFAGDPQRPET